MPNPTKGGVERVTSILIRNLTERGHVCKFLLLKSKEFGFDRLFFEGKEVEDLRTFLRVHFIDVIINQCYTSSFTRKYKSCKIDTIKYITCYHDAPGTLLIGLRHRLACSSNLLRRILLLIYPLYKIITHYKYRKDLQVNYNESDSYILLSHRFSEALFSELGIHSSSKVSAIPNPLSFELTKNQKCTKEKIAIVVARLEESQKRVSESLYIWSMFKQSEYGKDWILYIIGDGQDKLNYMRLTSSLGLSESVIFTGRTDPIPYYTKAKLFFMTSSHEGWGLTITESMQFGVVPIAYNTYASLLDIIIDNKTGFIIPDKCRSLFLQRIIYLSSSEEIFNNMSSSCMERARLFSQENIANMWNMLIGE